MSGRCSARWEHGRVGLAPLVAIHAGHHHLRQDQAKKCNVACGRPELTAQEDAEWTLLTTLTLVLLQHVRSRGLDCATAKKTIKSRGQRVRGKACACIHAWAGGESRQRLRQAARMGRVARWGPKARLLQALLAQHAWAGVQLWGAGAPSSALLAQHAQAGLNTGAPGRACSRPCWRSMLVMSRTCPVYGVRMAALSTSPPSCSASSALPHRSCKSHHVFKTSFPHEP